MGNRLNPDPTEVVCLVTMDEARQRLRLSTTTLFGLIKAGELRSVKIGRSLRIRSDSITDLIEKNSTGPA